MSGLTGERSCENGSSPGGALGHTEATHNPHPRKHPARQQPEHPRSGPSTDARTVAGATRQGSPDPMSFRATCGPLHSLGAQDGPASYPPAFPAEDARG